MSTIDEIASHIRYIKNAINIKLNGFLIYRKVYTNYRSIIIHILRNDYPIQATLRNGGHITLHNRPEATFVTISKANNCVEDIENDIVTFTNLQYLQDKKEVRMRGSMSNGEVFGIFQNIIYGHIPLKGRIVIDVGANIGDSSIYFALKGAKKVISIEPFPKNYFIAKENIELNNLSDKINILLAGCAAERGSITIDNKYQSSVASSTSLGSILDDSNIKDGDEITVPLVTLESVLDDSNIKDGEAILKMDCEGCEYDSIISASNK